MLRRSAALASLCLGMITVMAVGQPAPIQPGVNAIRNDGTGGKMPPPYGAYFNPYGRYQINAETHGFTKIEVSIGYELESSYQQDKAFPTRTASTSESQDGTKLWTAAQFVPLRANETYAIQSTLFGRAVAPPGQNFPNPEGILARSLKPYATGP